MGVLPRARINDKLREETRTDRVMRSLAAWAASKLGRGDQRTVESLLQLGWPWRVAWGVQGEDRGVAMDGIGELAGCTVCACEDRHKVCAAV